MKNTRKSLVKLTETAVMLALLICLQWVGSQIPHPLTKQLISGSLVNCTLAVTVLLVGLPGGISLAVISPVCAFLLGIAPNFITVAPIMLGNSLYVLLLWLLSRKGKAPWQQAVALAAASAVKFAVLYVLVVQIICGAASGALLGKKLGSLVVLAPPMLQMLPAMFSWPQLVTALTGGVLALLLVPVLRKALHK